MGARRRLRLLVIVAALTGASGVPQAIARPLHWSGPFQVLPKGRHFAQMSCATPFEEYLCVAVTSNGLGERGAIAGNLVFNTPWTPIALNGPMHAVACPTLGFCAATMAGGGFAASEDPLFSDERSWQGERIASGGLGPIVCPAAGACYVGDDAGDVFIFRSAHVIGSLYTVVHLDSMAIVSIQCPSKRDCIAIDARGTAFIDHDAINPAAPWRAITIDPAAQAAGTGVRALTCPDTRLCLAVDEPAGVLAVISAPFSAAPQVTDQPSGVPLSRLTCASKILCLGAGPSGHSYEIALFGGAATGAVPFTTSKSAIVGAACFSATACLAVNSAGYEMSAGLSIRPGFEPPS